MARCYARNTNHGTCKSRRPHWGSAGCQSVPGVPPSGIQVPTSPTLGLPPPPKGTTNNHKPTIHTQPTQNTLGAKFVCCGEMTVTRRRKNLNQQTRNNSKALNEIYHQAISKHDLKTPGIFFRTIACDLGFAVYELFYERGPSGSTKGT